MEDFLRVAQGMDVGVTITLKAQYFHTVKVVSREGLVYGIHIQKNTDIWMPVRGT